MYRERQQRCPHPSPSVSPMGAPRSDYMNTCPGIALAVLGQGATEERIACVQSGSVSNVGPSSPTGPISVLHAPVSLHGPPWSNLRWAADVRRAIEVMPQCWCEGGEGGGPGEPTDVALSYMSQHLLEPRCVCRLSASHLERDRTRMGICKRAAATCRNMLQHAVVHEGEAHKDPLRHGAECLQLWPPGAERTRVQPLLVAACPACPPACPPASPHIVFTLIAKVCPQSALMCSRLLCPRWLRETTVEACNMSALLRS